LAQRITVPTAEMSTVRISMKEARAAVVGGEGGGEDGEAFDRTTQGRVAFSVADVAKLGPKI
jgi:hypothetical protein